MQTFLKEREKGTLLGDEGGQCDLNGPIKMINKYCFE